MYKSRFCSCTCSKIGFIGYITAFLKLKCKKFNCFVFCITFYWVVKVNTSQENGFLVLHCKFWNFSFLSHTFFKFKLSGLLKHRLFSIVLTSAILSWTISWYAELYYVQASSMCQGFEIEKYKFKIQLLW